MPRGAGTQEGAIQRRASAGGVAFADGRLEQLLVPAVDKRADAVAKGVESGARRLQPEEQPAHRQGVADVDEPLLGGGSLLEVFEEDQAQQQRGVAGKGASARVTVDQRLQVERGDEVDDEAGGVVLGQFAVEPERVWVLGVPGGCGEAGRGAGGLGRVGPDGSSGRRGRVVVEQRQGYHGKDLLAAAGASLGNGSPPRRFTGRSFYAPALYLIADNGSPPQSRTSSAAQGGRG